MLDLGYRSPLRDRPSSTGRISASRSPGELPRAYADTLPSSRSSATSPLRTPHGDSTPYASSASYLRVGSAGATAAISSYASPVRSRGLSSPISWRLSPLRSIRSPPPSASGSLNSANGEARRLSTAESTLGALLYGIDAGSGGAIYSGAKASVAPELPPRPVDGSYGADGDSSLVVRQMAAASLRADRQLQALLKHPGPAAVAAGMIKPTATTSTATTTTPSNRSGFFRTHTHTHRHRHTHTHRDTHTHTPLLLYIIYSIHTQSSRVVHTGTAQFDGLSRGRPDCPLGPIGLLLAALQYARNIARVQSPAAAAAA